ncbi:Cro/CI family transcriptional regulator [Salinicola sp. JS01]|uniref:Cro/CI family transcriptional regulator n=1 Tax=Salinicola sp. JS01 TaxID=3050071 RepID=UPI00255C1361|nr:Cro/CI family transcriptional regulator [Salinicola sp. JS01]WIX32542.1 Cro/CI family transcriptional regulator [Salinicola sp. JS01]
MTKQDVIEYFGGTTAAAKALGRSKGAVSQWPDALPANLQFEIEGRTCGRLQADEAHRTRRTSAAQRA